MVLEVLLSSSLKDGASAILPLGCIGATPGSVLMLGPKLMTLYWEWELWGEEPGYRKWATEAIFLTVVVQSPLVFFLFLSARRRVAPPHVLCDRLQHLKQWAKQISSPLKFFVSDILSQPWRQSTHTDRQGIQISMRQWGGPQPVWLSHNGNLISLHAQPVCLVCLLF